MFGSGLFRGEQRWEFIPVGNRTQVRPTSYTVCSHGNYEAKAVGAGDGDRQTDRQRGER